ncbi:transcriptional regulator with XRE-family HTH domain [Methylobacterium sp. BE186]|uniref:LexA family protein n=1 Tax=Methylobacterium sp. BE186 TaxID=2817715 RepID=UPI002856D204|nr:XRE family transcriptional regulator [Methylobacterium sp. BE186]MDR7037371.1 transcriptional regulator with XRE-family HTH domain [Methylobacterium sp. BE186]
MDVKEIMRALLAAPATGGRKPTQAEVAELLGVSQSTVSKWATGRGVPEFEQAQVLRRVAIERGILTEVTHGLATNRTVAIVGCVGLGEEVEWFSQGDGVSLELVELPFPVPEGCFALEARGNSMHPRVKDGEVIVARQNGHTVEDLVGQEVVLRVKDGPYLFKTLRRGIGAGRYTLESFNAPSRENVEVEWVAELWAIVPNRRWVKVG